MGLKIVSRPRLPKQIYAGVRGNVQSRIKPVVVQHVLQRQQVVRSWHNRPIFGVDIRETQKSIILQVFIKNATQGVPGSSGVTVSDLWRWRNFGTKPHMIFARPGGVLAFQVDGVDVFTRFSRHPGTKAHRDDQRINRKLRRSMNGAVKSGYR